MSIIVPPLWLSIVSSRSEPNKGSEAHHNISVAIRNVPSTCEVEHHENTSQRLVIL